MASPIRPRAWRPRPTRTPRAVLAACLAAVAFADSRGSAATPSYYDFTPLSLTGPAYESLRFDGTIYTNSNIGVGGLNSAGEAAGTTDRAGSNGVDAWIGSAAGVTQVGLTGSGYQYPTSGGGTYRLSTVYAWTAFESLGKVVGSSARYGPSGYTLGTDYWIASRTGGTVRIGPTGPAYEKPHAEGMVTENMVRATNAAGQVFGSTQRYNATLGGFDSYDLWLASAAGTQIVGLTGPGYDAVVNGRTVRSSEPVTFLSPPSPLLTATGWVAGNSFRYSPSGTFLGKDAFIASSAGTVAVGLTGPGYGYSAAGGTYRSVTATMVGAGGHAIGSSGLYSSNGNGLGGDAWIANSSGTNRVGLVGADYEYFSASAGGTWRSSSASFVNAAGQAIGFTSRTNVIGADYGRDAWLATMAGTQMIGLYGAGYEYTSTGLYPAVYRYNEARSLNDAGIVFGNARRYVQARTNNQVGNDPWIATTSGTQRVGLTGADYEYPTSNGGTYRSAELFSNNHATGVAVGQTNRYNGSSKELGKDAWLYTPAGGTVRVGLTGTGYEYTYSGTGGGIYRNSFPDNLTADGRVIGYSDRYTSSGKSAGRDWWVATPGAGTRLLGLTGPEYEYTPAGGGTYRESFRWGFSDAAIFGGTNRYSSLGQSAGFDSWIFTSPGSVRINLAGPGYEYLTASGAWYRSSSIRASAPGATPMLIGFSSRYTPAGGNLGQAGWLYDGAAGDVVPLEFSFRSTDNYSFTYPQIVTDSGVVLGYYTLYSGANSLGNRAFWWSRAAGFFDLGLLLESDLAADGWATLASTLLVSGAASNGSPQFLVGGGYRQNQYTNDGTSLYLLTATGNFRLPGDADLDGDVDSADLAALENGFLNHLAGWANGDFNNDARVSADDFAIFSNAYARYTAAAAVAAQAPVPEPALAPTLLSVAALVPRRRRQRLHPAFLSQ